MVVVANVVGLHPVLTANRGEKYRLRGCLKGFAATNFRGVFLENATKNTTDYTDLHYFGLPVEK